MRIFRSVTIFLGSHRPPKGWLVLFTVIGCAIVGTLTLPFTGPFAWLAILCFTVSMFVAPVAVVKAVLTWHERPSLGASTAINRRDARLAPRSPMVPIDDL